MCRVRVKVTVRVRFDEGVSLARRAYEIQRAVFDFNNDKVRVRVITLKKIVLHMFG